MRFILDIVAPSSKAMPNLSILSMRFLKGIVRCPLCVAILLSILSMRFFLNYMPIAEALRVLSILSMRFRSCEEGGGGEALG